MCAVTKVADASELVTARYNVRVTIFLILKYYPSLMFCVLRLLMLKTEGQKI